jgi:hypothetical protein
VDNTKNKWLEMWRFQNQGFGNKVGSCKGIIDVANWIAAAGTNDETSTNIERATPTARNRA